MTKFEEVEEEIKFLTYGKKNIKDVATSYVLEIGETIEGIITEIKDSEVYKKVYRLEVKGEERPVICTGKTALNNQLGFGNQAVKPAKVGDIIQVTWLGMYTTKVGKGYDLKVKIARA